jgi:GAF domain-containing protein
MTLPSIIPNLVHLARSAARAEGAGLWLLTPKGDALAVSYYEGLPQSYIDSVRRLPVGTMSCGRAVMEKTPVLEPDLHSDPDYAAAKGSPIKACFSVPVIGHSGKVYGSIACHYTHKHRATSYDVERNQLFAKLIAFAIEESAAKTA